MVIVTYVVTCSKCGMVGSSAELAMLGQSLNAVAPNDKWGYHKNKNFTHMICPKCMKDHRASEELKKTRKINHSLVAKKGDN